MTNMLQIVRHLRAERDYLTHQITTIDSVLKTLGKIPHSGTGIRLLSAAGRRSIAAAQKARWAKIRERRRQLVIMPERRTMSATSRKKIAAAQRARWAKVRALRKAA